MITIEKTIDLPDTYPLDRLGRLEELLFFDIETTGFSAEYSQLYLIGCTYHRSDGWHLIQWFADTPAAESELLIAFFEFLKQFTTVVHFNGDGFDIPYLLKRCQIKQLPYDFSRIISIDIYKKIKPYRKLLQLENLKQKSLERFLGIHRQDPYNGGQLIEVYRQYLKTRDDSLYDMLMLHNREDLEGMPLILPILNYPDFLEHPFTLTESILEEPSPDSDDWMMHLEFQSAYSLPVAFSHSFDFAALQCREQKLTLTIPLLQSTLKYFYPNYKDYYYLIYEDMAVHKSVGEFVDRSARKKATAQTCYSKKTGVFLPQPSPIWEPALKKQYKDKLTYVEYHSDLFLDTTRLERYLHEILQLMM